MNCGIASEGDYDLWSAGLLETSLAEDIASHLYTQCGTCVAASRQRAFLWWAIACVQSAETAAIPSTGLRSRVLAIAGVQCRQAPRRTGFRFHWPIPAFAGASLLAGVAIYRNALTSATEEAKIQEIARLQREVRRWQQRATTPRESRPTSPAPSVIPRPIPPGAPTAGALEKELDDARRQMEAANDALSLERARSARLETEINALRLMSSTVASQKEESERKLNATAPKLAEMERQLALINGHVRELEQENSRYRTTILRLERQVSRDVRLVALLNSPSVQLVKLSGTEAGAQAAGKAFVAEGDGLVFHASNLPALPKGRTYQLWLLRGRTPAIASGGFFDGNSTLEVNDKVLVSDLRGLAVTEEPEGGSPGPTGHKLLVGTIKPL